jgi:alanyl-tRNA synthetase
VRKSLDEIRAAQKERKRLLEELAELHAAKLVAEAVSTAGVRLVVRIFADRDAAFIKLLAQKITAGAGRSIVALLGALGGEQPALIFAQTPGGTRDMGALMKETLATLGGRGGGNKDMAQGGAPPGADLERAITAAENSLQVSGQGEQ